MPLQLNLMKHKKRRNQPAYKLKSLLLSGLLGVCMLLSLPDASSAHPAGDPPPLERPANDNEPPTPPSPPGPPAQTPVDGGLGLLLAAGAAYGIKRMRRKENPSDVEEKI